MIIWVGLHNRGFIMSDGIEEAIKAINIPVKSASMDTHNGADKRQHSNDRIICCPSCKNVGTSVKQEKLIESTKKIHMVWICTVCGSESKRLSYRKHNGPRVSETRSKKLIDISDGHLPNNAAFRGLSSAAKHWLAWGHAGHDDIYTFRSCRWDIYLKSCEFVKADKNDDSKIMFARLFSLVEVLIIEMRSGSSSGADAEIAKAVGVHRSQFQIDRRWGKVRADILQYLQDLDDEIGIAFSASGK